MRYVLLCRHGAHRDERLTTSHRDGQEEFPIDAVSKRLREELEREAPPGRQAIALEAIRCAETPVAQATLCKLLNGLPVTHDRSAQVAIEESDQRRIPIKTSPALKGPPDLTRTDIQRFAKSLLQAARGPAGNAVLVVGHQPTLGRLADELLHAGRHIPLGRTSTPLDPSGIVCVAITGEGARKKAWIAWAISYDDAAAAAAVREKITLKMSTAKSFGGLLTIALTVVLGVLVDSKKVGTLDHRLLLFQLSAGLYLLAAGLYIVTMYNYDSLLMPTRF
ncbi:hypothetical protein [Streptomyces sp. NPDC046939]|uniref:hypothetical protein n=1 Tax=Streptomyces sp. NPDC046939 TaxID=3155376 RepID=UPI0033F5EFB8